LNVSNAADEQTSAHEKERRERGLKDEKPNAQSRSLTRAFSCSRLEIACQIGASRLNDRRERGEHSHDQHNDNRNRHGARTGENIRRSCVGQHGGSKQPAAPPGDEHPRAAAEYGHPAPALSINSHGFLAATSQAAADEAFPAHKVVMDKIGRERGWPPMTRAQFDAGMGLRGHSFVGSPQQMVEKILFQHELFGHDRFMVQFSVGTLPHASIMRSIELFGTEVAPAVRKEIDRRPASAAA